MDLTHLLKLTHSDCLGGEKKRRKVEGKREKRNEESKKKESLLFINKDT